MLRKQAYDNNILQTTTDYIEGFVYVNSTLSYASMPEGRLLNNAGTLTPEYMITDQQGNARISFKDNGSGAAVVTKENSYYGFGLIMPGSAVATPTVANKQLYNGGSEWQNDFSNLPDYYQTFYRNYDAAIGRWVGVDPDADGSESLSVYQYAANNPIMYNDVLGNKESSSVNGVWQQKTGNAISDFNAWENSGGGGGGFHSITDITRTVDDLESLPNGGHATGVGYITPFYTDQDAIDFVKLLWGSSGAPKARRWNPTGGEPITQEEYEQLPGHTPGPYSKYTTFYPGAWVGDDNQGELDPTSPAAFRFTELPNGRFAVNIFYEENFIDPKIHSLRFDRVLIKSININVAYPFSSKVSLDQKIAFLATNFAVLFDFARETVGNNWDIGLLKGSNATRQALQNELRTEFETGFPGALIDFGPRPGNVVPSLVVHTVL